MKQNISNNKGSYYDLNVLRNIPIENVCYLTGIDVNQKGSRLWVKLRNEKTSSAIINQETNTIYDFGEPYLFGTNSHGGPKQGNPLDLIQYIYSCGFTEATERLADLFNIEPVNTKSQSRNNAVTDAEYSQIGVYGNLVSKNLNYDTGRPVQELFELAEAFSFPVNDLKNSGNDELMSIYEEVILRGKALPYIQQMRNSYFVSIWEQYSFLKDINALELFDSMCSQKELTDSYNKLVAAEKIFNRAAEGTNVKKISVRDYSPNKILEDILKNRIKPELGVLNYKQINKLARERKCTVRYEAMETIKYYEIKEQLDNLPNRAFFSEEQIIVGYLSNDSEKIDLLMERVSTEKELANDTLADMVSDAENRKNNFDKDNPMKTKQNNKGVNSI